jgi:hypothetical protein
MRISDRLRGEVAMIKYLLVGTALFLCTVPASAKIVTNTFIGTVVASNNVGTVTTTDFNTDFGGGNLIGKRFTLTMTLDSSQYYSIDDPSNPSFITGGTFYNSVGGSNPITASLTINGKTVTINDSSDAFNTDLGNGTIETYQQAFSYNPGTQAQIQGVALDLTTNVPASPILTTQLPPMLVSNGDFVNNYALFYDQSTLFSNGNVEYLALDIAAVNAALPAVPELSTWAMMLLGFAGAGLVAHRRTSNRLRASTGY